jgi:hypothetical protein
LDCRRIALLEFASMQVPIDRTATRPISLERFRIKYQHGQTDVMPAKAGIQIRRGNSTALDTGFRRYDDDWMSALKSKLR